ncbi:hypothetical protein [Jiangella aurantiaca]|uniref:hypothetical protein n=1 Tax=Jiangella aurantiaca TaxID=2530373 RepID=UPI00193EA0F3|nr:hypothetical protein [Jiangella aurantiaca]
MRSGHGDTDLVLYSLRKYLKPAVKGNRVPNRPELIERYDGRSPLLPEADRDRISA